MFVWKTHNLDNVPVCGPRDKEEEKDNIISEAWTNHTSSMRS